MNQEMFAHIANAAVGAFKSAVSLFKRVLNQALEKIPYQQNPRGDTHLAADQLILDILDDPQIGYCFKAVGISASGVRSEVEKLRGKEGKKVESASCDTNFQALKTYGRDLVEQARKLDQVICRDEEIRSVVRILSRRTKNNPVLIGEPGVGRTAIVEGVANRIVRGDVPSNLADVRLIALVAGAKYSGEFKERWNTVLKEVEDANGKVILFIDEIHLALGTARTEDSMYAANLFKPMLARGQLRCIGATTQEEYSKYVEKYAAFQKRFQQVYVAEPSVADTISILRGLKETYEGHHGVRLQYRALVVAAQLSSRYITGRHLPEKAIDLVDEACANVRLQLDSHPEEIDKFERRIQLETFGIAQLEEEVGGENLMLIENVGVDQIAEVVSRWTGIPVTRLGQNEKERLLGLAERLHKRVVGQDQAVDAVAKAIITSRVGLCRPQQSNVSFMFLGPTGVGKTELAKALAEQLFDDETLIVRINMSKYMEQHSVARLIGAPLGYIGHVEGGQLTEAVRMRPYSVLLFDEVEKAHTSVFDTLLQVLDDGKLTDGQGRTVDFSNTIIIMNSNLGAEHLLAGMLGNLSLKIAREQVMEEVRRHFRPKLLNRLDEIVVFDPLSHDQLIEVARLQMKDVVVRFGRAMNCIGHNRCCPRHCAL